MLSTQPPPVRTFQISDYELLTYASQIKTLVGYYLSEESNDFIYDTRVRKIITRIACPQVRKMRIAINAASVGSKKTGIGNYILGLIRALGTIDTENQKGARRYQRMSSSYSSTAA